MLPCRDSAVCLSVHAVPGFLGTWLPNIYRLHGSLALGCPTLRRSQLYDMLLRRHMGAQHMFWSTSLYILFPSRWPSFIMLCYTMWHLLLYDIDYFSGGYMWYIMDIWYLVYMFRFHSLCIHCSLWRLLLWTLLLYGREFIGTPVRPDFSMFHSVSVSWLCYWSAPYMIYDLITLQYYLMKLLLSLCCSFYRATRHPLALWTSRLRWSQLRWLCAS